MLNTIQINQKIMPYRLFHRAIDETLKIPSKCRPFLYLNLPKYNFCSSALPAQGSKIVITTVCVHMTTVSVIRESLSIIAHR